MTFKVQIIYVDKLKYSDPKSFNGTEIKQQHHTNVVREVVFSMQLLTVQQVSDLV